MELKILELFSGTQSISKAFREAGHETYCIEFNELFTKQPYNLMQDTKNIIDVTAEYILEKFGRPDVIWASPPCTTFSIAAISKHRYKDDDGYLKAKSQEAVEGDCMLNRTINLIKRLKPKYWYVENPRGGMRKTEVVRDLPRYTITYCQYGDIRMKPTDIWTNHPNPQFKKMCKNGMSCHESAPRGSKTGTQGLKGNLERSIIPQDLCEHIVKISQIH